MSSKQYWLVSVMTEQGESTAFCTLSHLVGDMRKVTREVTGEAHGQAVRCDKRYESTYGRTTVRVGK